MASAIDTSKPVAGNPTTASVRANMVTAASEISALQVSVASLLSFSTGLSLAGNWATTGTFTVGTTLIVTTAISGVTTLVATSPNQTGVTNSGVVDIHSGTVVNGVSGDALFWSGSSSGTGGSGIVDISSGFVTDTGVSGTAYIYSGVALGTGSSGDAGVGSGDVITGTSGSVYCYSGQSTGAGDSGPVQVNTGPSVAGNSGLITIFTGPAASGTSGVITHVTGFSTTGGTGGMTFTTGNAGGGNSGTIAFVTGTASGTRGNVTFDAPVVIGNAIVQADTSFRLGAAGPTWTVGAGVPAATTPRGSLYSRTGGGVGTTLYVSQGGGTWNPVAGV